MIHLPVNLNMERSYYIPKYGEVVKNERGSTIRGRKTLHLIIVIRDNSSISGSFCEPHDRVKLTIVATRSSAGGDHNTRVRSRVSLLGEMFSSRFGRPGAEKLLWRCFITRKP